MATDMAERKSRSMREMQQEANAVNAWECPRCGCSGPHSYKNWGVSNTYALSNGDAKRRRICRKCGQELMPTQEVPVPNGHKVIVVPISTKGKADD